ncbi:MAG: prepilin-type N-terminal cleavage/methylation domain-containing protein [Armatimonadota bacterium]|jgi:prepilin-type N-terminal cleavage/methylation domain-containing protein/prepilin-type processing-associated H-X9-DG protein
MMTHRRKGFTLIELLVVIAIIAILAAMLFPVFARARESARKIQCLSNVKNIATAVQMYLTDYDRFPPYNQDMAEREALDQAGPRGSNTYCERQPLSAMTAGSNPFLRWPVVLDEYVKNRDIWKCPSTQFVSVATWIVPDYTPVWYQYLLDTKGQWGQNSPTCAGPCCGGWPSGWGGTVTDSIAQSQKGSENSGAFEINIGVAQISGRKTAEITDPSWLVVCGDNPGEAINSVWEMFYKTSNPCCCLGLDSTDACQFFTNPGFRKKYAPHMGGGNIGFADGHAAWWDAEAAVAAAPHQVDPTEKNGCDWTPRDSAKLKGVCPYLDM